MVEANIKFDPSALGDQVHTMYKKQTDELENHNSELNSIKGKLYLIHKKEISHEDCEDLEEAFKRLDQATGSTGEYVFPEYLKKLKESYKNYDKIPLSKLDDEDSIDLNNKLNHYLDRITQIMQESNTKQAMLNNAYMFILNVLTKVNDEQIKTSASMIRGIR